MVWSQVTPPAHCSPPPYPSVIQAICPSTLYPPLAVVPAVRRRSLVRRQRMSTTHFPAAPAPAPGARRVTHDSHDSMEGSGEGTPSPEFWCHEAASGATVAKVVSAANIACQAPAHVSTDNSCHLTLVLSAAKETQTYLQRIRPLVLQLGDSTATEDITRAFKFTALSSQFLLASDLPNASSALIETWTAIQQLEERLAHKTSASSHSGLRGHKTFSPPGANGSPVPCDLSAAGMPHLGKKALLSSKHSFSPPVPGSEMERHPGALVSPPGGPTPNVDSRAVNPRRSSKRKSEAEMKMESTHENVGGLTLPPPNRNDPNIIAKRLKVLMERTQSSQAQLQVRQKNFTFSMTKWYHTLSPCFSFLSCCLSDSLHLSSSLSLSLSPPVSLRLSITGTLRIGTN